MKHYTEERHDDARAKPPDDGPWQDEPDKATWYDETTDMACMIVRNRGGALCGYVGVEPGHPWHGVQYGYQDDCPDEHVTVHGGLTYSAACQEGGDICHVPAEGRSGDVWWFGFDCAHAGDHCPIYDSNPVRAILGDLADSLRGEYRTVAYVTSHIESLAKQLAAVE